MPLNSRVLADAAFEDGLAHPDVECLAKIGGRGKFPGNMHRDLLHITGQKNILLSCLSNYPICLKKKEGLSAEPINLDFLLPHKLFSSMFHYFPDAFLSKHPWR